jgi:hypothetical protein
VNADAPPVSAASPFSIGRLADLGTATMCQLFRREQISCAANQQQHFAIHRQQPTDKFQQSSGSGQKKFCQHHGMNRNAKRGFYTYMAYQKGTKIGDPGDLLLKNPNFSVAS